MRLQVPVLGEPEERDYTSQELAEGFWRSQWGAQALQAAKRDLLVPVMTYLTVSRSRGGLEASWTGTQILRTVIDYIHTHRPTEGSP